jgi:fumarate reductase (CoM/CoB) subunit A
MRKEILENYIVDVAVVGGGIAALRAAIAARRKGRDVLLISKGKAGKSGCSLISEGIINGTFGDDDSPELFYKDIMKGSGDVADPALVKVLAENAKDAVLSLEDIGVSLVREDGELALDLSGGNSVARTVRIDPPGPGCGKVIPKKLYEQARTEGVAFLEGYSIIKIFTDEDGVTAALAYDGESFVYITCPSLVLATGGGGKLYTQTTNPNGITGDGYYLAHDAGASLVDMEYVQFFPTVALQSYLVLPFIFTDGATMVNTDEERFLKRYDPELEEKTTRDRMSRAIFTEAMEGRGDEGGVYISYAEIPEKLRETKYKKEVDFFMSKGIDVSKEKLHVRPACHFFMGGVKIDERCATDVPGLYACGECAGGVHGANRLAGNALAEALVFGELAGANAADYSMDAGFKSADVDGYLASLPDETGGTEERDHLEELKQLAWNRLGIIRSEQPLEEALGQLRALSEQYRGVESVGSLKHYFELRNALHVLRTIARAAHARTESRGAHYREDHPEPHPTWKKALVVKNDLSLATEPR